jgi:hypothetical protein
VPLGQGLVVTSSGTESAIDRQCHLTGGHVVSSSATVQLAFPGETVNASQAIPETAGRKDLHVACITQLRVLDADF